MIRRLAFAISDRCNASCDMCCFECSPKGERHLETGLIKNVLDEASNIDGISAVGFTGGEPFLYYDQILDCSRYAHDLGLDVQINTNGFWGSEIDAGVLKDAGVSRICFSTGRFHRKFVSPETLKKAITAAKEAGIKVYLNVMELSELDEYDVVSKFLFPEIKDITVERHLVAPVGKAAKDLAPKNFVCATDSEKARCDFAGDVELSFDGNYYMCCSVFSRETKRLCLGNAKEVRLSDLSKKILSDDYLYVMLSRGLSWYVKLAVELGFAIPDKVCSPCQLCNMVFENKEFIEKIRDDVEREAQKLRLQRILGR